MAFVQMPINDKSVFLVKSDETMDTMRQIGEQQIAQCQSFESLFLTLSQLIDRDNQRNQSDFSLYIQGDQAQAAPNQESDHLQLCNIQLV